MGLFYTTTLLVIFLLRQLMAYSPRLVPFSCFLRGFLQKNKQTDDLVYFLIYICVEQACTHHTKDGNNLLHRIRLVQKKLFQHNNEMINLIVLLRSLQLSNMNMEWSLLRPHDAGCLLVCVRHEYYSTWTIHPSLHLPFITSVVIIFLHCTMH